MFLVLIQDQILFQLDIYSIYEMPGMWFDSMLKE